MKISDQVEINPEMFQCRTLMLPHTSARLKLHMHASARLLVGTVALLANY